MCYLVEMKLMMEGAKPVNHRTHGSTDGDFCSFVDIYAKIRYAKTRLLHTVYYAEDEKQLQDSQIKTPARFI